MTARLHPDDLMALANLVAERVAERLLSASEPAGPRKTPRVVVGGRDDRPEQAELLTAQQAAAVLGVSAEWVRDHRDVLGVVPLGDGPRPRLRFQRAAVLAAMTRSSPGRRSEEQERAAAPGPRRRRAARDLGNGPGLLPCFTLDFSGTEKSGPGDADTSRGQATRDRASPRTEATRKGRPSVAAGRPPRAASERSRNA